MASRCYAWAAAGVRYDAGHIERDEHGEEEQDEADDGGGLLVAGHLLIACLIISTTYMATDTKAHPITMCGSRERKNQHNAEPVTADAVIPAMSSNREYSVLLIPGL